MMRRFILRVGAPAVLALASLAAGCASSPPSRFYRLTAVAPGASAPAPGALRAPVRVAAVHLPATLDREEIVRTAPGNRLEIDGLDRWGAPLDEMAQRVLTEDLIERLPPGSVVLPASPVPIGTGQIVVDLLAFQSTASGRVELQGSWSLVTPQPGSPPLRREVRYHAAAGSSGFDRQAAVMSAMLGRLADDIARSLPRR
jgi:uncharacterized lipoprotein YmbA